MFLSNWLQINQTFCVFNGAPRLRCGLKALLMRCKLSGYGCKRRRSGKPPKRGHPSLIWWINDWGKKNDEQRPWSKKCIFFPKTAISEKPGKLRVIFSNICGRATFNQVTNIRLPFFKSYKLYDYFTVDHHIWKELAFLLLAETIGKLLCGWEWTTVFSALAPQSVIVQRLAYSHLPFKVFIMTEIIGFLHFKATV